MLEDYGKLPQLYDKFKSLGYTKSFDEFHKELIKLIVSNYKYLSLQDNKLSLNISIDEQILSDLISKYLKVQSIEQELNIYTDEELTVIKQHISILNSWLHSQSKKPINLYNINSYSDVYNCLSNLAALYLN